MCEEETSLEGNRVKKFLLFPSPLKLTKNKKTGK